MKSSLLFLGVLLLVLGCKTSASTSVSKVDYSNYSEELKASLPNYPDYQDQLDLTKQPQASSNLAIDEQLDNLRMQTVRTNDSEPYFNGYTVLVYSGVDREAAFKTQEDLEEFFPDLKARMEYEQPRYLLKLGQYIHRIEAQKNYALLKESFPVARIIQDRIQRKDFQIQNETDDYAEGKD